ncbi:sterol O-acyltransferase 2 [Podospora fimiseda]|uniref:O-acyltransferase n=1 Tax=Podospora fimiseda TaxID=252190 RepID=A0AAN7H681_9PEZI|nr:sterol O-acyltransferase 2 [Podospora fimiseda]
MLHKPIETGPTRPHSLRDALKFIPSIDSGATTEDEDNIIYTDDVLSTSSANDMLIITPNNPSSSSSSSSFTRPTPLSSTASSSSYSPSNPLQQSQPKKRGEKRRGKFRDLVFTKTFTAFDLRNPSTANSTFHGFFTLFWLGVFLFVIKIAANNFRSTGSVLGTNEIMSKMMFGNLRELIRMLVADGLMCLLTGLTWVLQVEILRGKMEWDRVGWIVQSLWEVGFIGGAVGLTRVRGWPWTHTVFFVMHGVVMVMKMHSFGFYNGYLSGVWKRRERLENVLRRLEVYKGGGMSSGFLDEVRLSDGLRNREGKCLEGFDDEDMDVERVVEVVKGGKPLDREQREAYGTILKWEIEALTDELRGKATSEANVYPNNLTWWNHYEYIALPTVVYELEYPRSDSINWWYVMEKMTALFGIMFVMIMISQAFIYPVVMDTVRMKEEGLSLAQRLTEFPWMLLDLIFPFMMEYLLSWYLIWEVILNVVAELTFFADRSFYDAWWNCVSWDQFARDWNRPVHNFLLRHVYHSSISAMKVNKHAATFITFFLSACVHELVMWCIFKKLRGYLLFLQMCQLPLVSLSRTKWLRHRETLGNIIFWLGIFTGPSVLCSMYLIL